MHRPVLALLLVLAAFGSAAPARALDTIGSLHCNDSLDVPLKRGQAVSIAGVVTGQFSTTKNTRAYVQDATGGINVFGAPPNCAAVGDSVTVAGVIDVFNGLTEVTGSDEHPLAVQVVGHRARVPAPLPLTLEQVRFTQTKEGCEPNESRLVEVSNVLLRDWDGGALPDTAKLAADTNYRLVSAGTDSTSWTIMRITLASGCDSTAFAGGPVPRVPMRITGILSQHVSRNSTRGGYQILPRSLADIRPMAAIKP